MTLAYFLKIFVKIPKKGCLLYYYIYRTLRGTAWPSGPADVLGSNALYPLTEIVVLWFPGSNLCPR